MWVIGDAMMVVYFRFKSFHGASRLFRCIWLCVCLSIGVQVVTHVRVYFAHLFDAIHTLHTSHTFGEHTENMFVRTFGRKVLLL